MPQTPLHPPLPAVGPRVIGLGASAGGLLALEAFLSEAGARASEPDDADSGVAYVVVQHLDPTHKAMLVELLQRVTAMPVREAADAMALEAGTVHVIAPNTELTVRGGMLHQALPGAPRGQRLPIDLLFCSLAADQGARATGVVLSGMGSDGTLGLQAIHAAGGLTAAQQPESAQFDSMPRSAIATGVIDVIGPAADLPAALERARRARAGRALPPHVQAPAAAAAQAAAQAPAPEPAPAPPPTPSDPAVPLDADPRAPDQVLASILARLRARCRHDLSQYKPSTLRRRIQRRMALHGLATEAAYDRFVADNPHELDLLFKEMLIGVTRFFRDPPVWQALQDTVLPTLLARSPPGGRLRAWVAGCSTGEEAYSLAMLVTEVAEQLAAADGSALRSVQIIASDLSADAIAVARRGLYPAQVAADIEPARLARFFVRHGDGYAIDPALRERVLFAQHDVILDPPFTKLDLLSCRNLLIYFNAALQRRLIPLFSYSVRPGGALLLGSSETVGSPAQALFTQLNPTSRLYWRTERQPRPGVIEFPTSQLVQPVHRPALRPRTEPGIARPALRLTLDSAVSAPAPLPPAPPANLQALAEQQLLQAHTPPAVLVTDQGDVVYIHGRVGAYLEPASGKANWNIHVMAHPAIRAPLMAALRQALLEPKPIELRGLRLTDDAPRALDISVQAMREPSALVGLVMVVFQPGASPAPAARRRRRGSSAASRAEDAIELGQAEELQRWKDEVHALRQEMGASAEEVQAAYEELQSTNEELQSANEELTTSKEEAQSMNEELQTLNGELQSKLDALALAQSDMQNLLNSTDIATLFLDSALNVRRYTEQITRIIHLRETDIGRPLTDLASTLIYPQLHDDARETLRTLSFTEKEIATHDGLWFLVRIKPYRTLNNVIQGVVITLIDITPAKQLEARLRSA